MKVILTVTSDWFREGFIPWQCSALRSRWMPFIQKREKSDNIIMNLSVFLRSISGKSIRALIIMFVLGKSLYINRIYYLYEDQWFKLEDLI